jgi:hypothetical protein
MLQESRRPLILFHECCLSVYRRGDNLTALDQDARVAVVTLSTPTLWSPPWFADWRAAGQNLFHQWLKLLQRVHLCFGINSHKQKSFRVPDNCCHDLSCRRRSLELRRWMRVMPIHCCLLVPSSECCVSRWDARNLLISVVLIWRQICCTNGFPNLPVFFWKPGQRSRYSD